MLLRLLNKINIAFVSKTVWQTKVSWEKEEVYIKKFPEPKDDVERSYFQYRCECFSLRRPIIVFLRNLVAFFLLLFYLCKRYFVRQADTEYDTVLIYDGTLLDAIPLVYREKMIQVKIGSVKYLSKEDKKYIKKVWKRYPFSFFYVFKILVKLSTYCAAIQMHRPKHILCSSEASFPVSVLTKYCEEKGINHINFMHGILGYKCRLAFSRFSKEIVWDECYVKAMKRLRHGTTEYEISLPPSLSYPVRQQEEVKGQFTYYIQELNDNFMVGLTNTVDKMKKRGVQLVLRPHPRYNDEKYIKEYIPSACIENPQNVSIIDSLNRAETIIARRSTVLYQAHIMGKKILVDDVTSKEGSTNDIERYIDIWLDCSEKYLLSKWLEENHDYNI